MSEIILNKQNLLSNLQFLKSRQKNLCAMIKANAYGHGLRQVVSMLSGKVCAFGVVNIQEALQARRIDGVTPIIIFGSCDNIKRAIENDITLTIISVEYLKKVIKTAKKCKKAAKLHLNINSGMNRYGIKSIGQLRCVIKLLLENGLQLDGVFTHFSSLTSDADYTIKQKLHFDRFVKIIKKYFNPVVHVGGGNSIFTLDGYDFYRVGMFLYGYGTPGVKPVLSISSNVAALQVVNKNEHVGYLCSYTAKSQMRVGVIPIGYADGIKRLLSNDFYVKINDKLYKNVGNICMDCFMVQVDDEVKIGQKAIVFDDASAWAEKLNTTEYEILTGFNGFRGRRVIK